MIPLALFKCYESLMLLSLHLPIVFWKHVLEKRYKIKKIGQYIAKLSYFIVSKNDQKERYGVATVQIVYAIAYEWYKFSLLSELDMYFEWDI